MKFYFIFVFYSILIQFQLNNFIKNIFYNLSLTILINSKMILSVGCIIVDRWLFLTRASHRCATLQQDVLKYL